MLVEHLKNNLTFDDTRYNINLIASNNTAFGSHMTSVFTVTNSTTVIYLVAELGSGSATTSNKHWMSYTRIG